MKLPLAWLRDYLDVELAPAATAERFAALGFPVQSIDERPQLSGVVVGRLERVEKHPGADRLQVCTVAVGGERTLTIATAATNVAPGHIVPVATIGAHLVGLTIAPRTMRGIASEGMLCSADELGLEPAWFDDGILQLDEDTPVGADAVALFGLSDAVLDVEVTANRVDALSVLGLARELGAALGVAVREPELAAGASEAPPTPPDSVVIESSDCTRFVAQRIADVPSGPAPFWMRLRLALAGQRPIGGVVDVSNFVMLEGAQPLHFYDADRIAGGRLVVRDARDGERLRTLDGTVRELDSRFLVVADADGPQGLAGLMGGATSEVDASTRTVLVEAATFSGPRVRRMSVALGLRTEASARHEKGLPPGLAAWGAARAAFLLTARGARASALAVFGAELAPNAPIAFEASRIRALLGFTIAPAEAAAALRALGFTVDVRAEHLLATPPPWRGDVRLPEDAIEEIARVVGYDRIPAELPPVLPHAVESDAYRRELQVARALATLGYRELVTLSLQPAAVAERFARAGIALPGEVVAVRNPLSEDQRYLRFSLLPALLAHAARYAGSEPLRTFEIGHVFEGAEAYETPGVAWLAALPAAPAEPAWRDGGFATFKGEALALLHALTGRSAEAVTATAAGYHPGKTASLLVDGNDVAVIGAVDPRLLAEYELGSRVYAGWLALPTLPAYRTPRYVAPSKFPPIARDLALVVAPHVPAADLAHAIRAAGDGAIAEVAVFDEYRGPQIAGDKKSVTVRVVLQRPDATLTDAEADRHVAAILASLRERCDAVLRT